MTSVDADAPERTPLLSLSDELTFDKKTLKKLTSKQFSSKRHKVVLIERVILKLDDEEARCYMK